MLGAETDIATIAASLKDARDQHQRPVLFLGSRAGGLFNNEYLYKILKDFSLRSFNELSNNDKFEECYNVLRSSHFNAIDMYNILSSAIKSINHRGEDKILDELVSTELFETIITTNIDTLLEDSSMTWEIKGAEEYQILIHGLHNIAEIVHSDRDSVNLIKAFGDLSTRRYNTAGNELKLEEDREFKEFLEAKLMKNIVMIGYDPVWDWPLEDAFPEKGGTIWYINEQEPPQNTHLSLVLDHRPSKFLIGRQGSYSSFLRALYYFLDEGISQKEVTILQFPLLPQPQSQARKKVLISLSHEDRKYLERLIIHLSGYLGTTNDGDLLDIWDDTKTLPGANQEEAIKESLKSTKVVVLLVSADFLASDFIRKHELPVLLAEESKGEIELLPVILDSSLDIPGFLPDEAPHDIARIRQLYKYSMVNSVSEPSKKISSYEQEVVWAKLAEQIYDTLSS